MKRILALLLACLLVCLFAGCVEETYSGFSSSFSPSESSSQGDSSDSGVQTPVTDEFSAQLVLEDGGELPSLQGIQALWTGRSGVHRASFDESGFASSSEPDGEYTVTLSAPPDGYTYDPNGYLADNDKKQVVVTLYKIKEMSGSGESNDAGCYKLPSAGTYRFDFSRADQQLYFTFVPTKSGIYRFSSLMDATANEITASFYKHAVQFISPQEVTDTNGAVTGSYTKNFIVSVEIAEEELGQPHYFSIRIHSLSKSVFPTFIDMRLERVGDHPGSSELPVVEVPPIEQAADVSGSFTLIGLETGGKLDQRSVGSYTKEGRFVPLLGDDGYYRLNDGVEDGDVNNNPVLYAKLEGPIEGILEVGINDERLSKRCYNVGKDYNAFYAAHAAKVNADGCIPVTEALREFLYNLSVSNQYFWDGNGWAETNGGYQSDEESQWLFACGYYK